MVVWTDTHTLYDGEIIWVYAPQLFSNQNLVDRLSLYMSLKEEIDERLETALDELIGGVTW